MSGSVSSGCEISHCSASAAGVTDASASPRPAAQQRRTRYIRVVKVRSLVSSYRPSPSGESETGRAAACGAATGCAADPGTAR